MIVLDDELIWYKTSKRIYFSQNILNFLLFDVLFSLFFSKEQRNYMCSFQQHIYIPGKKNKEVIDLAKLTSIFSIEHQLLGWRPIISIIWQVVPVCGCWCITICWLNPASFTDDMLCVPWIVAIVFLNDEPSVSGTQPTILHSTKTCIQLVLCKIFVTCGLWIICFMYFSKVFYT